MASRSNRLGWPLALAAIAIAMGVSSMPAHFYRGDPHAGDIFYVTLAPDSHGTFSPPVRVNSQEGSAVAIGTIRGPHLALGRAGRAHVAWIGSKQARPTAPSNQTPLLYTRLNDERTGFEPQRNLIRQRPGLDAGASVAADTTGNVYVAWHAPGDEGEGEQYRRIWVARSSDDGKSFAAEVPASTRPTGACVRCAITFGHGVLGQLRRDQT